MIEYIGSNVSSTNPSNDDEGFLFQTELELIASTGSDEIKKFIQEILDEGGSYPSGAEMEQIITKLMTEVQEDGADVYVKYGISQSELTGLVSALESIARVAGDGWNPTIPSETEVDVLYKNLKNEEASASPQFKAFLAAILNQFGGRVPDLKTLQGAVDAILSSVKDGADVYVQYGISQDDMNGFLSILEGTIKSFGDKWQPAAQNETEADVLYKNLKSEEAGASPQFKAFLDAILSQFGGKVPDLKTLQEAVDAILTSVKNGDDIYVQYGISQDDMNGFFSLLAGTAKSFGDTWHPAIRNETEADAIYLDLKKEAAGASPQLKALIAAIMSQFGSQFPTLEEIKWAISSTLRSYQEGTNADIWIQYGVTEDEMNQFCNSLNSIAKIYTDSWQTTTPSIYGDLLYWQLLQLQTSSSPEMRALITEILRRFNGKIPSADQLQSTINGVLSEQNNPDFWVQYGVTEAEMNQFVTTFNQIAQSRGDTYRFPVQSRPTVDTLYLELENLEKNCSPQMKEIIDAIFSQFGGKVPDLTTFENTVNETLLSTKNGFDIWIRYGVSESELHAFINSLTSIYPSWKISWPPKTEADLLYLQLLQDDQNASPQLKVLIDQILQQFGTTFPTEDQMKAAVKSVLGAIQNNRDIWMWFTGTASELNIFIHSLTGIASGWNPSPPMTPADNWYLLLSLSMAGGSLSDLDRDFLQELSFKYSNVGPTPDEIAKAAKEFLGELNDPTQFPGLTLDFLSRFIQATGAQNIDSSLMANLIKARNAYSSATDPLTKKTFLDLLNNEFTSNWTNKKQADLIAWAQAQFGSGEDAFWQYPGLSESDVQTLLQIVNGTQGSYAPTTNDKRYRIAYQISLKYPAGTPEGDIIQQGLAQFRTIGSQGTDYTKLNQWVQKEMSIIGKYSPTFQNDFLSCFLPI